MTLTTDMIVEKTRAQKWFETLQQTCRQRFENLEAAHWTERQNAPTFVTEETAMRDKDGGGGVMSILRGGRLFEKVGINASTVHGSLAGDLLRRLAVEKSVQGWDKNPKFWASGVSVVAHPLNPYVPAVHFNTRMFWTPTKWWFGGGADLNPYLAIAEDTEEFHTILRKVCDRTDQTYYSRFRQWADDYFFILHRKIPRGVGGIFFDDLNTGDWPTDFQFVTDVGRAFFRAYLPILLRRQHAPWSESDRDIQLVRRGHYAEFNLVYDRGTKFGLESGHDPRAVLMSLPPLARWP